MVTDRCYNFNISKVLLKQINQNPLGGLYT